MDTSDLISSAAASPAKRIWRRHDDAFKARVIELARQPHTSVAAVALANGLNANMLRRWVREAEASAVLSADAAPKFVQLPMPAMTMESVAAARPNVASVPAPSVAPLIEIRRGDTAVYVTLPADADSAAWVREVLR